MTTATALRLPGIYVETRPSGSARVGFRVKGRKIQRTFDYAHEGEAWAEEARATVLLGLAAGRSLDDLAAEVLDRDTTPEVEVVAEVAPTDQIAGVTLARYARTWLDARRGSVERTTWDGYETHVNMILADRGDNRYAPIGSRPVAAITRTEVEAWRTRIAEAGTRAPTLNARLKVLRMIFRWALSDRLIPNDPTEPLKFRPTDKVAKTTLSVADEARLVAECKTDADRLLVRLGTEAGLRWSEASALVADCLVVPDDGPAYLVIRRAKRRNGTVKAYTKDGGSRQVAIAPDLVALFRRVALPVAPGDLLFPWSYDNYRHRVWKGVTARAGLTVRKTKTTEARAFGFHQLRHTCATRLAAAGVPRTEIAAFLGHADESTTAGYIHALDNRPRHELILAALTG